MNNELAALSARLAVVDDNGLPRTYCMGVLEERPPANANLLVRGEIDQRAQVVERGFPQVLCSTPIKIDSRSSGRLELARWIGSNDNPLTARVMVNRIWQNMIGEAIVTSTENFGAAGQRPSHPELLDHLAVRFVETGCSVKTLVRHIATSRAYRMASTYNMKCHEHDPDNALIWRANPRRLDAESIRDAMLCISGEIDFDRPRGSEVAKAGYTRVRNGLLGNPRDAAARGRGRRPLRNFGAGTFPPRRSRRPSQPGAPQTGPLTTRAPTRDVANPLDMEDAKFRSVYLPIVRDEMPRSLEVFDLADPSAIIGKRESSNTANQALYMMNNPFVIQQSGSFARRVAARSSRAEEQIKRAFLLALGRPPTAGERSATVAFFHEFKAPSHPSSGQARLSALCQSLFASAEFRFID